MGYDVRIHIAQWRNFNEAPQTITVTEYEKGVPQEPYTRRIKSKQVRKVVAPEEVN